jgi:hypothetical protein
MASVGVIAIDLVVGRAFTGSELKALERRGIADSSTQPPSSSTAI